MGFAFIDSCTGQSDGVLNKILEFGLTGSGTCDFYHIFSAYYRSKTRCCWDLEFNNEWFNATSKVCKWALWLHSVWFTRNRNTVVDRGSHFAFNRLKIRQIIRFDTPKTVFEVYFHWALERSAVAFKQPILGTLFDYFDGSGRERGVPQAYRNA